MSDDASNDASRDIGTLTSSKVLAVIVLYKCTIVQSSTCTTIQDQDPYDREDIDFLVYDNSPDGEPDSLPSGWAYVSDPTNRGLPCAYNYAISQAKQLKATWLLLLDQDSNIPSAFLANLMANVTFCHPKPEVAAIVPLIFSNHRQISPFFPKLGLDRPYRTAGSITQGWITAINSGAAIRVSFIESIGGFSSYFWLDYLDHWLFRKIFEARQSVFVSNIEFEHSLSVADFNQRVEPSRYKNVLAAETYFTNRFLPSYWRAILALRLLARSIKHAIFTHDKRIALIMFLAALKQLRSILAWHHIVKK